MTGENRHHIPTQLAGYDVLQIGHRTFVEGDLNQPLPGDAPSAETTQTVPGDAVHEDMGHLPNRPVPPEKTAAAEAAEPAAQTTHEEAAQKVADVEAARENIRSALASAGVTDEGLDTAKTIGSVRKIAAKHLPELAHAQKAQSRAMGEQLKRERQLKQDAEAGRISPEDAAAGIAEIRRELGKLVQDAAEINARIIANRINAPRLRPRPEPTSPAEPPPPPTPPAAPSLSSVRMSFEPPVRPMHPSKFASDPVPTPPPAPAPGPAPKPPEPTRPEPDAETTQRVSQSVVNDAETTQGIDGKLIGELDLIGKLTPTQLLHPAISQSRWYQNLDLRAQKAFNSRVFKTLHNEAQNNPRAFNRHANALLDLMERDQAAPAEHRMFDEQMVQNIANRTIEDTPGLNQEQIDRFADAYMKARTKQHGDQLPHVAINQDDRAWTRQLTHDERLALDPFDPTTYPDDMKAMLGSGRLSPEGEKYLARYRAQAYVDRIIDDRTSDRHHTAKNTIPDKDVIDFLAYAINNNLLDDADLAKMEPHYTASMDRLTNYFMEGHDRAPGDPPLVPLPREKSADNPEITAPVPELSRDMRDGRLNPMEQAALLEAQGGLKANERLKQYLTDIKGKGDRINIEGIGSLYLGGMTRAEAAEAFELINAIMKKAHDTDQKSLLATVAVRVAHAYQSTEPYKPPVQPAGPTEVQERIHDWLHNELGKQPNNWLDRKVLKGLHNKMWRDKEHIQMVLAASGDTRALAEIAFSPLSQSNLSNKAQKLARRLLAERMALEQAEEEIVLADARQRIEAEKLLNGEVAPPTPLDTARDLIMVRRQQLTEYSALRAQADDEAPDKKTARANYLAQVKEWADANIPDETARANYLAQAKGLAKTITVDANARKAYFARLDEYIKSQDALWNAALSDFLNSPEVRNDREVLIALDDWRRKMKKGTKHRIMDKDIQAAIDNQLIFLRSTHKEVAPTATIGKKK